LDRTESPVLDDLPVDAVVDVSRAFGRLQEHGEKAVPADEATLVRWGEAGFAWLNRDDKSDDLVDAISRHRNASGEMAPLVPIRALGSIAELSALHYRGADRLTALIARRLGKALGYPVFDIWRTDYRDLASCLASTGLEKEAFVQRLHENGWLSACLAVQDDLAVPVDTLWKVGQLLKNVGRPAFLTNP
jgi:hypothetical protein